MTLREKFVDDLLEDLCYFRVETLVLEPYRPDPPASPGIESEAAGPGPARPPLRRPTDTPPTDPLVLRREVVRLANVVNTSADLASQEAEAEGAAPELGDGREQALAVDPEVVARASAALGVGDGAAGPTAVGEDVAHDHRQMRADARYWELRHRSVWCRTTMRLDGDAATELRFEGPEATSVNSAHTAITIKAIDQWQLLIVGLGTLLRFVGGFRAGRRGAGRVQWRAFAQSVLALPPPGISTLGVGELARRAVRLYSVGRVVFESPAAGAAAMVRTMVLASGDVETSIRRGTAERTLQLHTDLVTRWLAELAYGFKRWSGILTAAQPLVAACAVGGVALNWLVGELVSWQTLASVGVPLVLKLAVEVGRLLLRRKLLQLLGHGKDEVVDLLT